jgi:hypothetical protein
VALLAKFFGRTASEGAAFALGVATGPVLYPAVREIEQEANKLYPSAALDPADAAEIVAEDVELRDWGAEQAERHGLNGERFDALTNAVRNAPGLPELLTLWRRGEISSGAFVHGLRKARLETRWDGPLQALKDVLLTPAELANARQQGYIDAARQYDEAAKQGVDNERAEIQYRSVGLPPGHAEAQELLNRGLIDAAEFATMIREGHTKTKYTDVLRTAAQYVLTPINYVEGRLRGWIDDAAMYAGTSLRGVSKEDTDLLFKIHGRPLSWHQIWIGLRRGGTYNGPTASIDPAFLSGLRQSDIRPEWYDLAWAQRFTYPTAFVLRALTESGDITEQEAHDILLFQGWEPGLAAKVASKWATPTGTAKVDPWITKAEGQLWTATHKAYVKSGVPQAAADTALQHFIPTPATRTAVFALWDAEKVIDATPSVPGP